MGSEKEPGKPKDAGAKLGRWAGKFVKNAGPNSKRLVEENRPRVEKAVQDARPKVEKAVKDARPKVEKAVKDYRPRVEQAGRDAARYAQEHEDELRSMAIKGARMRLGPLGMAIDALGLDSQPAEPTVRDGCRQCGTVYTPRARFCSECGTPVTPDPGGSQAQ